MPRFEIANGDALPELSPARVAAVFDAVAACVPLPADLSFSIAMVSAEDMLRVNRTYRGKDATTDVLSFRYDDRTAEILLAPAKLRAQAQTFGHTVECEAAFLLAHGILHALGWDHERSAEEEAAMQDLEKKILRQCGYSFPR